MPNVKRLFIEIGLRLAMSPLKLLRNTLNLVQSSLRATFRTAVVGGFFAALRAGFQTITNLQQGIVRLTGEMAELNLATIKTAAVASRGGDSFAESFYQAASVARELSTQVSFTANNIQAGLFTATQAALSLNESLQVTSTAMALAQANGEAFQRTLNSLIGISRAFQLPTQAIQGMSDVIEAGVLNSKATVGDLFEGLRGAAAVASTAFGSSKKTFIDTTAALMTLNDAGIEGSMAGNRLRAAMLKLMGGTQKSTAAFTKYGVNLFRADAQSQKFLQTLLKGQRAFTDYEDKINELKNSQFELILAGKQNTDEYANIAEQVDAVTSTLDDLEKGLDTVYDQFQLAGGTLKPFSQVLNEISKKAPAEVIGRAFGIRGGEPIIRLLKDIEKFNKFVKILEDVNKESEKGKSILQDVFGRFLESVVIRFERIKNTVIGIFSVIADAAFDAFGTLFDPLQLGFEELLRAVEANRGMFRLLFEGISNIFKPIVANAGLALAQIADQMEEILVPGARATLPIFSFNRETGGFDIAEKTLGGDSTIADKLGLAMESAVSIFVAGLERAMVGLDPLLKALGKPFAEGLSAALFARTELFIKLGALVAGGFFETFKLAMSKYLPQLMSFIQTEFGKILSGITGKLGPFALKLGFKPTETTTPAGAATVRESQNMAFEKLFESGMKTLMSEQDKESNSSFATPYGSFSMNPQNYGINTEALNEAANSADTVANNLNKSAENLSNSMNILVKASENLAQKSSNTSRDKALKDLKVK